MNDPLWPAISGVLAVAVAVLLWMFVRAVQRGRVEAETDQVGKMSEAAEVGSSPPMEELLEHMAEGVLVLDSDLNPRLANAAARSLLGLGETSLALRDTSEEVVAVARQAHADEGEIETTVSVWYPARGHLRVRAAPLNGHDGVIVVIQDITQELRTQRIRREFVAHASHELKSPVASLQTLAEAVRQAVGDDPESAERFSTRLVHEAERLARLIADLLDLSRLEDPDNVAVETVNLSRAALGEWRAARAQAGDKGVDVSSSVSPRVYVRGDLQQLSLMLRNLLDNAVRYTPAGGHVALDLRIESSDAVVRVIDTGIGIPREAQARVFERFYRVDRARSRDRGGTGLGLAIVKHAVELHGGSIELDSELERGSTFTVRLPAAEQPAEMERIAG